MPYGRGFRIDTSYRDISVDIRMSQMDIEDLISQAAMQPSPDRWLAVNMRIMTLITSRGMFITKETREKITDRKNELLRNGTIRSFDAFLEWHTLYELFSCDPWLTQRLNTKVKEVKEIVGELKGERHETDNP